VLCRMGGDGFPPRGLPPLAQPALDGLAMVERLLDGPRRRPAPNTTVLDAPWPSSYGCRVMRQGRVRTIDDIADAVRCLVSERASYINGASLVVDGSTSLVI